MPDLTAVDPGARYQYTGYLSHIPRTVVFSRAVNMASMSFPMTAITYDNAYSGTGAYTDVEVGMTVIVYSGNTSTVKGLLRVAYGGASSTVLQVNEFENAYLHLQDNDRFDVVREFDIWDVLVSATEDFNKDSRRAYVDEGSNPPPVCNSGGDVVGFVDSTTGFLTASHYGDTSFRIDPDAGSLTHAWTMGSGATPTSSTNANPAGVTYPAGKRFVKHVVTDSNGKTATQFVFVHAAERSGANAPLSVQMREIRGTVEEGYYRATFSLPRSDQAALSALPNRAYIVYWEEERYDGSLASYGANVTGRSHIKFAGYIDHTSIHIEADSDEVVFEALGPLGILEKTGALPQLLINDSTPSNWQEQKSLTVWRMLWYLLYWGSTAMLRHDFLWPDGEEFAYSRLAVEDVSSIAGQLKDLASGIRVQVTCDWLGRLLLVRDPDYLTAAEMAARTKAYDLTTADAVTVDLEQDHRPQYKLVIFEGITAAEDEDDQKPVFALAPGKAPGPGTQVDTMSRQIVVDIDEAKQSAGDRYAQLNSLYYDETTKAIVPVPRGARLGLPDGYHVFDPMLREPVTFALPASANARGLSFGASDLWTAEEIAVTYDAEAGTKDIQITIDHATHGKAGRKDKRPQPSENGLTSSPPGVETILPGYGDYVIVPDPFLGLAKGTGTLAAFRSDNYVQITNDWTTPEAAGGPTFLEYLLSVNGNARGFVVDAFSPGYPGGGSVSGGAVNGVLVTDHTNAIYTIGDIFGARTLTLRKTLRAALTTGNHARCVEGCFGAPYYVCVSHYDNSAGNEGTWYTYSLDGGATWAAETRITALYTGSPNNSPVIGIWLSSRNPGMGLISAYSATGTPGTAKLYRLSNNYATVTQMTTPADYTPINTLAYFVHVPWHDNDDESIVYFHALTSSTPNTEYVRRKNRNGTVSDITPLHSNGSARSRVERPRGLSTSAMNRQSVVCCAGTSEVAFLTAVFRSVNGGDSWAQLTSGDLTDFRCAHVIDDPNTFYVWGRNGALGYSTDGTTIESKMGSISTTAEILNICGGPVA